MLIIILLCVLIVFWYLWSWLKPRHPMSPPMYPGALPIIGHAHKLLVSAQDMWSFEKMIYNYCLRNEDIAELRFGPNSIFVLTDPDDCLTVANNFLEKPYFYHFGDEMYGRGLVTATESVWKPHRKLLNPAFNQQVLHTFVEEFIIQGKSLVLQLSSEVGTGPFDVQPYLMSSIMSTACRTTFGLKPDGNRGAMKDYAHALEDLLKLYIDRLQRVWLHLPFIFNWSSYKKKENNLMKVMKDFTKAVITNRKSELRLSGSSDKTKDTESVTSFCEAVRLEKEVAGRPSVLAAKGATRRAATPAVGSPETTPGRRRRGLLRSVDEDFKPLLDQMLELADKQDAFTEDEIREHLDTIVAGAYDTTATTLTFILIVIGSHQDVQERIYKELQEVFGNQERDLNRHDLPKLVYVEAVIKETLRLYPTVPRIARCSSTDVQLKNYILPANGSYLVSVYGLNRHPMWGADADQFRPERWLHSASLPKNPSTFASFSLGRRNCIGKLYAMMAVKTTVAYVLRAYRIKSDLGKLVTACNVLLQPVSGHEISLESRT